MCWSSATLFYGTFVKAIPLYVAAGAWDRAKPVLLALDLISLRRRNGTLRVKKRREGKAGAQDVPIEVWELVKQEVVDLEIPRSEDRLARPYEFERSFEYYDMLEDTPPPICRFPFHCECDDGMCGDVFMGRGGMSDLENKHDKSTRTLLLDFGFAEQPFQQMSLEEHVWIDTDALLPIALPLTSSTRSSFSSVRLEASVDYGTTSEYATLDPSIFSVPASTFSRFQHFLSLFRFETFYPTTEKVALASSRKTAVTDSKAQARSLEEKRRPQKELALAWHLGGSATLCG
ncbi:hypothetical protein JCM8097_002630 [Rhodosporidiobolus ruineniae]